MENSVGNVEERTARLINWFEGSEETTQEARDLSERDRDYYDGIQLTTEQKAALAQRKQPEMVINRVKRKINFLTGFEKLQRTDPKAFARTPQHDEDAEAATDALRYIADNTKFEQTVSSVWENMLIEGYGGCELSLKFPMQDLQQTTSLTKANPKIVINYWAWDRLGYDPHSKASDFSDSRYFYGIIWMDLDEAKKKWPRAEDQLSATMSSASTTDTYEDKPRHSVWADTKRRRVRVVQMYYRDAGEWHWSLFTKGGEIKGGRVPFVDEDGESFCPMILQSLYVNRENQRYGEVRDMVHPQDEINKRRSKLLHKLNVRQVIAEAGAVDNERKAQEEIAKPDGYVKINPGFRFEIPQDLDQTAGQFSLLQHATQEIDLMGPNASLQGKGPVGESGRAVQAKQQGGTVEIATPADRLRNFRLRVYEAVWALVRQYWSAEQWVRVTDDEDNVRFVGLNQQVSVGELFLEQKKSEGLPAERFAEFENVVEFDDRARLQVIKNNVAEMDVDIVVEEAPDVATIQQEQFADLVNLANAGVQFPPEVYLKASSLRNKDELLETLKGGGEEDPEVVEARNAAGELEIAAKQAEVDKVISEAQENRSQAVLNTAKAASEGLAASRAQ